MLCRQEPRLTGQKYSNGSEGIAMPSSPTGRGWYVAYTRPRQEYIAELNLSRQAFETYLPRYKKFKKAPSAARRTGADAPAHGVTAESAVPAIYEPMFPRYLFFRPSDPRQSIAAARSSRGVSSIVGFGAELACVDSEVLLAIRALEEERNNAPLHAVSPFQPGTRVRLRNSALDGLEGLVHAVSAKRVFVLMELLGRQQMIRAEHGQIEQA